MPLISVALYSDTKQCEKLEAGEGEQEGALHRTAVTEENKGVLQRWLPCSVY